jgi:hypothetical protein
MELSKSLKIIQEELQGRAYGVSILSLEVYKRGMLSSYEVLRETQGTCCPAYCSKALPHATPSFVCVQAASPSLVRS